MSRSYKKYPVIKDRTSKFVKRLSSKKIRKWLKDEDRGFKSSRQFKHQLNQYDIHDWIYRPDNDEDIEKYKRK